MIQAKIGSLLAAAGAVVLQLTSSVPSLLAQKHDTERTGYAGDQSCVSCHRVETEKYRHTPHRLASQLPTAKCVLGSFQRGSNALVILESAQSAQPGLQFVMESHEDGFFEIARSGWNQNVFQRKERIDVVTGS